MAAQREKKRMKRRTILIIACTVAVLVAAVSIISYIHTRPKQNKIASTNSGGYAILDVPPADSLMVGKWRNAENPHWYKVYYDDYGDEGYFWGKEWDESEDVHEEDLNYHGNGWFLWKSEGKLLTELHSMDVQNVKVPKVWRVQHLSTCAALLPNDSLILVDKAYSTHRFHFTKQSR